MLGDQSDSPPAVETDESASLGETAALADTVSADQSFDEDDGAEHRQYKIKNHLDTRLDVYLHGRLKGISRNRVQKLIDLGGVTVNDSSVKASLKVRRGDVIDIILPPPAIRKIEPQDIPLTIVYEDDDLIIINKQADLVVHPARSHLSGTLLNALAHHFHQKSKESGGDFDGWKTRGFRPKQKRTVDVKGLSTVGADQCRPGIVHRLDRYTTGVMVVAKSDEAHLELAKQFEQRTTIKAYLALVHGAPDPSDGPGSVINEPIGKHPTIREAYAVRHDSSAKDSVTLYRVRERYQGYTLLELELKTGRTHQIRVHLQYLGMPIAGDITYGGELVGEDDLIDAPLAAGSHRYMTFARTKEEGRKLHAAANPDDLLACHPALHASYLQIEHPTSKERMTFTAPLHDKMCAFIRKLRERPAKGPIAKSGYWLDLDQIIPK